eukprot:gene4327-4374_t
MPHLLRTKTNAEHRFENMQRQTAGAAMRRAVADRAREFGHAQAAIFGERQFGLPNAMVAELAACQSPAASVNSTSPPKKFGSGTRIEPSVP